MLKLLFNSETRVKLLNLFLLHSENQYSANQLAGELKLTSPQINKELINLIQLGLVIEILVKPANNEVGDDKSNKPVKAKNNKNKNAALDKEGKKYFTINRSFILYPEIKSLFIKSQILSSQNFILNLEKNFQAKLVLLTGFFTNYPEAQTDLLIVGEIKRPAFLKLMAELEKDLGRELNFTIMDEKEFNYRQEIMDIFLYNIIEGKKIILIDTLLDK